MIPEAPPFYKPDVLRDNYAPYIKAYSTIRSGFSNLRSILSNVVHEELLGMPHV